MHAADFCRIISGRPGPTAAIPGGYSPPTFLAQGDHAMQIHRIGDVTVLNDYAEVPGLGFLPVNAYVLHAEQPVVIDAGLSTVDKDFVSALAEVLDPADVRWHGLRTPTATTLAVCGRFSKPRRKPAW